MSTYRIGDISDLLGVSDDTVRRLIDAGELQGTRDARGHRVIDGEDLAIFLRARAAEPVAARVTAASARNRMRGIVTEVVRGPVMARVEVQAGPHRITSLMSREAADELALEAGMIVIAAVKATNVTVGIPEDPHEAAAR